MIAGIVLAILDRRSGKGSDVILGERSEFHSISIEGTFRIISTIDLEKGRISRGERKELESLWSTSVCRSLTTMDLNKTHSFEERQMNVTHFDG